MAIVRKIKDGWQPMEKPDAIIGDLVNITDPHHLIKTGAVEHVADSWDELEDSKKDQIERATERVERTCTICGKVCKTMAGLTGHMRIMHPPKEKIKADIKANEARREFAKANYKRARAGGKVKEPGVGEVGKKGEN